MHSNHIDNSQLVNLLSAELTAGEAHSLVKHLSRCPECKARYDSLGRASLKFSQYCELLESASKELSPVRRSDFIAVLYKAGQDAQTQEQTRRGHACRGPEFYSSLLPKPRSFAGVATGLAASLLFAWLAWGGSVFPPHEIAPANLLAASVSAEMRIQDGIHDQVVSQTVRIQAPGRICTASLHRSTDGKRKQKITPEIQVAETALAGSGIVAYDPLSAARFLEWHDHQHVLRDIVTRPSPQFLTLTTVTSGSEVKKASITFREGDLHPVERTADVVSKGTIEIAEVEYRIAPWRPQMDVWFEPVLPLSQAAPSNAGIPNSMSILIPASPQD